MVTIQALQSSGNWLELHDVPATRFGSSREAREWLQHRNRRNVTRVKYRLVRV